MATGFPEQDPHRVRDERENILEVAIGREVRAFRARAGMTVAELSKRTGLSIGMLSKIENGNTSPSLTTLQSLSHALNVPVTAFFRRFEDVHNAVHTKSGRASRWSGAERGRATSTTCSAISARTPAASWSSPT
jgi:DNA-binding XRE family transcriptional regulator